MKINLLIASFILNISAYSSTKNLVQALILQTKEIEELTAECGNTVLSEVKSIKTSRPNNKTEEKYSFQIGEKAWGNIVLKRCDINVDISLHRDEIIGLNIESQEI